MPPEPEQLREKVVCALSGPTTSEPEVLRLPDQPPLAVQLLALLELQLMVVLPPAFTSVLLALRFTSGAGPELTETLDVRLMLPPGPVQVSWKLLFEFRGPVLWLPVVDRLPDQPPLAWQLVALLLDQVS